ncbi:lysylphosphatidylglycerol synthase transmembrane domain-containing protein [Desulfogranum mediterraneum]|uniref:lysylphosphatidylglycerol synthase transmembrane domain-containing protein n=1 Tax=Desulfogranum mediterraneum TaxID=160661 RepID=UPI000417AB38|nr:lysylphosphatidylglycerol synthase transmembrane domain-containing protein [Desulfogranum mediterraneum]
MKFLSKAIITILLFVLIFRAIDLKATMEAASTITLPTLLAALMLQLGSNAVASLRWSIIMEKLGFSQPFSFYLKSYFKGAFFNQGLPTSIGGDGLRILDAARVARSKEKAIFGVFIDRIIGLGGLLLLNILALLQNFSLLPGQLYQGLLLLIALSLAGLLSLFFLHRIPQLDRIPFSRYLLNLSRRYAEVYSSPGAIALQIGLSVLTHLLAMTAFFLLGNGVGMHYPLQVYLALVPPVILLTILPVSLAGWGIREGAMVGFFLLIGADKATVLSFSILYGLLALVSSLPGLVIFLSQDQRI